MIFRVVGTMGNVICDFLCSVQPEQYADDYGDEDDEDSD